MKHRGAAVRWTGEDARGESEQGTVLGDWQELD